MVVVLVQFCDFANVLLKVRFKLLCSYLIFAVYLYNFASANQISDKCDQLSEIKDFFCDMLMLARMLKAFCTVGLL